MKKGESETYKLKYPYDRKFQLEQRNSSIPHSRPTGQLDWILQQRLKLSESAISPYKVDKCCKDKRKPIQYERRTR